MKKIYSTLSCLILIATASHAQTLTSASIPPPGTAVTTQQADGSSLVQGNSGTGQTWNFAGAVPTGAAFVSDYINVAGTPYGSSFPSANLCQRQPDGSGGYAYAYYYSNNSIYELHGLGTSNGGVNITFIYTNAQTGMQFPATLNSTFSDVFAGSYTISVSGTTINNFRSGSITSQCDGSGTLITPSGTFTNTLRFKLSQALRDSTVYVGLPIPAAISLFNATTYDWFCTNAGSYLNQFYLSYDTTVTGGIPTYRKNAYYEVSVSTGINEPIPYAIAQASVYPNPASDYAFFVMDNSVHGTVTCKLYDVRGRIAKEVTTQMVATDRFEWMFPIQDLATGLYKAHITCQGKQWQATLLKN
jgi:hypothetical protein